MGFWPTDYLWPTSWFKTLDAKLDLILKTLNKDFIAMSKELDDLTVQVTSIESAEQSAITLLEELSTMIADAANDPKAIAAIAAQLKNDAENLAAAVVANTPAA
jgi:hypothetical protein